MDELPVADKATVVIFSSVLVYIDDDTGTARAIERVDREDTLTAKPFPLAAHVSRPGSHAA